MAEITKNPHNEVAFEKFLEEIGNVNIENWTIFAKALEVDRTTLVRWRKHPRAQKAFLDAINSNILLMEKAGALDWKMYREKLKMLGVKDENTIEHEAGESITQIIDTIEQTNYAELADKARSALAGQVVEATQPIQDQGQTGTDNNLYAQPDAAPVSDRSGKPPVQPPTQG